MSKKLFIIFTSVVSLVLFALLSVQFFWIENAFRIKQEQFELKVNDALSRISKKVEEHETVLYISHEMVSLANDSSQLKQRRYVYNFTSKVKDSVSYSLNYDVPSSKNDSSKVIILSSDTIMSKLSQNMHNSRWVDTMHSRKMISNADLRTELMSRVKAKSVFVENVVNKLIRKEINTSERIQKNVLDSIVKRVFREYAIVFDYQYSVQEKTNKVVLETSKYNKLQKSGTEMFRVQLFQDDIISDPIHMNLYFPNQDKGIFNTLGVLSYSSVFLTLVVILSFVFVLFRLIQQKKLQIMKTDFVNNMTHELKTPISTISLASQMLKDTSISVEKKNLSYISGLIEDESKRLGFLVERVLQMAIFEKGKINLRLKHLSINNVLDTAVNNISLQVTSKGGYVNYEHKAEQDNVYADEVHITNVVINLVDNAIKYCKEVPEINIKTENIRGGISIFVEDNGIGISKDNQKRIFEQFYRVHTGNVHNVKGYGLGLSYVKKILDEHKGRVSVDSTLGKGTKFEVWLPIA